MDSKNAALLSCKRYAKRRIAVQNGGQRVKIVTADKVQIDSMFFDRRQKTSTGGTLIITCEGNASFYEASAGSTLVCCGWVECVMTRLAGSSMSDLYTHVASPPLASVNG